VSTKSFSCGSSIPSKVQLFLKDLSELCFQPCCSLVDCTCIYRESVTRVWDREGFYLGEFRER
jgi:hypothetical protein